MRLEFFGCGTSQGVPEILCDCKVCTSIDENDKRLRSSIYVKHNDFNIVVDITPDFREQCLRSKIPMVDAIFLTHLHADHFMGMDDIRKFNKIKDADIPLYLPHLMEDDFRAVFHYTLKEQIPGLFRPRLSLNLIDEDPIMFGEMKVTPLKVLHGDSGEIRSYLFESDGKRIAYLTDCKVIPDKAMSLIKDCDIAILGALWDKDWDHSGHWNLQQAIEVAKEINAKQSYFTHITHLMGLHKEVNNKLPKHTQLAHDGLVINL